MRYPFDLANTLFNSSSGFLKPQSITTFQSAVQPGSLGCVRHVTTTGVLGRTSEASFSTAGSMAENRDGWDVILLKVGAGEDAAQRRSASPTLDAVVQFLQAELDKADRNTKQILAELPRRFSIAPNTPTPFATFWR